ncbi:MAG: NTP transferase domain-containing protein [Candidatus Heimdallarchaeaceae archaeon]
MEKYNAIIYAGRSERDDILCDLENVTKKGFIKLGDKTFLERIVNEFLKCEEIGDIYISGMNRSEWDTDLPVIFNEDTSGLFDKVVNIYKKYITKKKDYSEIAVVLASDTPLVTTEIISNHIKNCKKTSGGVLDGFFYYSFIKKESMEAKFPESNRTYATFKEFQVCGGDLTVVNIEQMLDYKKVIDDLFEHRKSVFAQLLVLNPFAVIQFLLKRLSITKFVKSVNRRIFKVKKGVYAVLVDDAEIAMDADKPHQLEEIRRYYNENKNLYD